MLHDVPGCLNALQRAIRNGEKYIDGNDRTFWRQLNGLLFQQALHGRFSFKGNEQLPTGFQSWALSST
jgi:hypothetical protein